MNLIFVLLMIPAISLAAKIPVEAFDQAKLESLLRSSASTLERTETREGFVRKHHVFPKNKQTTFSINCIADYFGESRIPSYKSCDLNVSNNVFAGDEQLIKITDAEMVKTLRESISYGDEVKKFYSFERVYGQAFDGTYRNLFRFSFICKRDTCDVTFATKNPAP